MGRTADYSKQTCGIAATLEVVGDPWTLLILRDAFWGVRRFEQWQERLGVARNVLAARLKSLVAHGVLETRAYSERPPRNEYLLTDKGQALRPVLLTMADWGNKQVYGDQAPALFIHDHCDHAFTPRLTCDHCGEGLIPGDLRRTQVNAGAPTVGEALARSDKG
ncbi:MAG: helix-turn-helix domain-containing protein [Caulobacter sp.]|nr:helix-turn-helix domain-containing protein [Caulobacter sp.]